MVWGPVLLLVDAGKERIIGSTKSDLLDYPSIWKRKFQSYSKFKHLYNSQFLQILFYGEPTRGLEMKLSSCTRLHVGTRPARMRSSSWWSQWWGTNSSLTRQRARLQQRPTDLIVFVCSRYPRNKHVPMFLVWWKSRTAATPATALLVWWWRLVFCGIA